jgi:23S rRNA (adenine2503-C2)-methyltransferase
VTGLTFEEVARLLSPSAGRLRELRASYRRLMRCESSEEPDLRVRLLPVAHRVDRAGVTKFTYRTSDQLHIESVVVPMQHSQRHWKSVCVSSQVGCARGCTFCETATLGLIRNLTAAEIVAQVLRARREFGAEVRTVVFMGMGEPFDNFDAVLRAVRVINDRCGLAVSMARITISTAGVVDGLCRIATLGYKRLNLAVSLNAPNDEIRSRIMPIARTDSMAALQAVLSGYPLRNNQHFMIEYVLIPGVNDAQAHAQQLAAYLRPVRCMVNVIAHNPRHNSRWAAPSERSLRAFLDWLRGAGQPCRQRVTRGRDELAACGQLGGPRVKRPALDPSP